MQKAIQIVRLYIEPVKTLNIMQVAYGAPFKWYGLSKRGIEGYELRTCSNSAVRQRYAVENNLGMLIYPM